MKKTLIGVPLLLAVLAPGPVGADETMRCGSGLIEVGDRRFEIRARCGEPADVEHHFEIRRRRTGTDTDGADKWVEIEVEVEHWTYNFGPRRFMRVLRFVAGTLKDIETLGYGF